MAIYNGFTHWKWWFFHSFLLVYQRVVLSTIQRLGQVVAGNKFKVSGGWPVVGLAATELAWLSSYQQATALEGSKLRGAVKFRTASSVTIGLDRTDISSDNFFGYVLDSRFQAASTFINLDKGGLGEPSTTFQPPTSQPWISLFFPSPSGPSLKMSRDLRWFHLVLSGLPQNMIINHHLHHFKMINHDSDHSRVTQMIMKIKSPFNRHSYI